ncbi:MAG: tRNA pseudouridine(54/55) synthase Pus10 [Thermoplasmata archaeon]|nr:tRNA pseudouridine(54/55) synthase Pus10 [Thermoplasmata archaeon]
MDEWDSDEVISTAKKLSSYRLCDSCLGRQFATVSHGMSNEERGAIIRQSLGLEKVEVEECWLCGGMMGELRKFSEMVVEAMEGYEYETFLVGSRVEKEILVKEGELLSLSEYGESIKREINREVGKLVSASTGKEVDFIRPHITAIINTQYDDVELDIRPLYIYGRYRKLIRGIPQTKWPCRKCKGKGCDYCHGTGKMYEESVEEIIAERAVEIVEGKEEYFHGAGREDIDVLMLGNGRPFILEIREPRRRKIDLSDLQKEINSFGKGKVEVSGLRFAEKGEIEKLKAMKANKTYRVVVSFDEKGKINEAVNALRGCYIAQRTPLRVVHRRADKIRERKILDIRIEEEGSNEAVLVVKAESGTYIKELMTGDGGRTKPSLSELAGCAIEVKKLDVINIGDEDGEKVERN